MHRTIHTVAPLPESQPDRYHADKTRDTCRRQEYYAEDSTQKPSQHAKAPWPVEFLFLRPLDWLINAGLVNKMMRM